MSCQDCNESNISLTGSWFPGSPCIQTDCGGASTNAACVIYNGANLECSGIETLDNLEVALQKIDEQICAVIGDYSTYTMNCLPDWWEASITTQAEFVDAITSFTCNIYETFNTFVDVTYAADLTEINDQIAALNVPGITCATASVTNTDTLVQILNKYCTKMTALTTAIDISSVVWNNCFTVVSSPTTIAGGFQLLADQICDVYDLIGGGGILPVFNNYGSCIGGTSSDSLVTTIGLIKTRLCLTPTLDNDNLTSDCITIPSADQDLEGLLQNMLDGLDLLKKNYVTFDGGDFTVSATSGDPCDGITVALATPLNQDRFVAVSAGDASPSTLIVKIASAAGSIAVTNNADTTLNLEISDSNKGDITTTVTGTTWTINNDAVTYAKMQNITTGKILGRSTAGTGNIEELSVGTGLLLSGGVLSATSSTIPISSLLAATASNTIDNGNYQQAWAWNALNGANGLTLSSTSTAGVVQYLLSVNLSGAMIAANTATSCAYFLNSHTGTNSSNTGIIAGASGGTDNYGIVCWGAGGQWGTSGGASIYAQGRMRIDGQIDTYGSTSGVVTIKPAAAAGTWTLTLPTDDGDIRKFLTTDGSGVTSWGYPLAESTYTPTLYNTTNIAASTAYTTRWYRAGNIAHVWGTVDIDATSAATPSELGMELPAGSNLGQLYDLAGTAAFEDGTAVKIVADTTNDRAKFLFSPVTATNNKYTFHFTYIVI